jgi:hypothetical protein
MFNQRSFPLAGFGVTSGMMSLWEERAARNEALFREVNEQVETLADRHGDPARDELGVVCECSDDACTERLQLSVGAYEAVRSESRHFLVVPGHEGDFEHVVAARQGYLIVEKDGAAGLIAEQTDPRS